MLLPKIENAGLDKYSSYIKSALNKGSWKAQDLNDARVFMADK